MAKSAALGMKPGSALHLDMEAYDTTDTACDNAGLTYVRAWHKALGAKQYRSGSVAIVG